MGGFYGGKLALTGQDVTFIARGTHLETMLRDGLSLEGPDGNLSIEPTKATNDPATIIGPVDAVLFCVKLYDAEEAAELIRPIVGDDTAIVSIMNGVDGPARIAAVLGKGHVVAGAAYDSATIKGPGVVEYRNGPNRVVLGALSGEMPTNGHAFAKALGEAGFNAEVSDNIHATLWEKLVLLATSAGLTALPRRPVGEVYSDEELRALAIDMMKEVIAVAEVQGINVSDDVIKRSLATLDSFPPTMYASAYFDLAAGKRMEVASFSGLITRLGAEHSIPTPLHRTVWCCLKPYVDGAPG